MSSSVEILSTELSEREKSYHEAQCEIIDLKEKQGQEIIRRDEIHSNQISTLSRRIGTYIAENELLRSDLRKAERDVREYRSKLLAPSMISTSSHTTSDFGKKHDLWGLTKDQKSDSKLLAEARKEIQLLQATVKDRNTQLSVMMETVDVLQAGVEEQGNDDSPHHSLQQDRIIELTARLSVKSARLARLTQQNEKLNSEITEVQNENRVQQYEEQYDCNDIIA